MDIGSAESGGDTGDWVDKGKAPVHLQILSEEEIKTRASEETSTNKYVPGCLSQKTKNAKSYTHCSVW